MIGLLLSVVAVAASTAAAASLPPAHDVRVPPGFRAEVYARGLRHPTAMAFGPGGLLYVTEDVGRLVAVGRGTTAPRTITSALHTPLGLAWRDSEVFVSDTGRIVRMTLAGGRVVRRTTVVAGLPHKLHQQDNIVLGRNGRLYFGNGSTCNACRESDRRSATILSMRPDGSDLRVEATGLRNAFGLAFRPGTSELYATVNGRDDVDGPGDPEPAEMLVRVRRGASFGWPDCWPSARLLRMVGACAGVTQPVAYLEPHSSADGMAFWRGQVYVAEWGTYKRARFGQRVVRVSGSHVSVFADGFAHPLALVIDSRGALLVADWQRGIVYRIQRHDRP